MGMQTVSGISPVQAVTAYGSTQSDVSSLEKQRDRLMMELERVNAGQGGENVNRREQLQRQIRLIEAQLTQRIGSTASVDALTAAVQDQPVLPRTELKGGFRDIGLTDPRTATVNAEGHFDALI
ncbi:hypothetical protein C2I18_11625 [Paenibacillus sp. PK3_47]|uniref:FlxA-like family protein n=1 Tax=Paenibacillus sp. PK3_47 TaxID=2072642 RepID=UPI00201DEF14|nr:FlxA-like family protein [Paenibacillus sp. PK3_47]UQZ34120.1 hypothetical protein C2I18_11625 [Paenibacillus sp. PK3_47]